MYSIRAAAFKPVIVQVRHFPDFIPGRRGLPEIEDPLKTEYEAVLQKAKWTGQACSFLDGLL